MALKGTNIVSRLPKVSRNQVKHRQETNYLLIPPSADESEPLHGEQFTEARKIAIAQHVIRAGKVDVHDVKKS